MTPWRQIDSIIEKIPGDRWILLASLFVAGFFLIVVPAKESRLQMWQGSGFMLLFVAYASRQFSDNPTRRLSAWGSVPPIAFSTLLHGALAMAILIGVVGSLAR
jgi:hypothetical protein